MRVRKFFLALLLALGLLLSAGCASGGSVPQGEVLIRNTAGLGKTTTYRLQEIAPAEITQTGSLTVSESWQLIKPVLSGTREMKLKEICVSRGQSVKAGDPIFILQGLGSAADIELKKLEINAFESRASEMLAWYEDQIAAAEDLPSATESQRKRRELQLEYARLEYEKYQNQSEYSLSTMTAQLAELEAAAGEIVLTAPVSGSIHSLTSRYAPGDLVPPGTELCSVYGSEGLRFYGSSGIGNFVYGREITVRLGKGGRSMTVTGRVVSSPEVVSEAIPGSAVLLEVDATEEELTASEGDAAVTFTILSGVYAVPKSCIRTRDGVSCVDLLVGDTVCTRNVVRGPGTNGMVSILNGLREGDQVVVSSYRS